MKWWSSQWYHEWYGDCEGNIHIKFNSFPNSRSIHSLINPFNPSWPFMDVQVSKMVSVLRNYRVICKAKIELHISPNTCMLVCGLSLLPVIEISIIWVVRINRSTDQWSVISVPTKLDSDIHDPCALQWRTKRLIYNPSNPSFQAWNVLMVSHIYGCYTYLDFDLGCFQIKAAFKVSISKRTITLEAVLISNFGSTLIFQATSGKKIGHRFSLFSDVLNNCLFSAVGLGGQVTFSCMNLERIHEASEPILRQSKYFCPVGVPYPSN